MAETGALSEMPPAALATAAVPRIWLLLGNRAGDRAQVEALGAAVARTLSWSCAAKRIVANSLFRIPNLLLGASLLSIDKAASDPLSPPWPDLVIAAGRRAVPAARWIRRQSGGRTRLVHIGRPWAPLAWFDLVVTTPQYALPGRPNLLLNRLPLSPHGTMTGAEAAASWEPRLAALKRPWIAVLVGGAARPYRLDADAATRLGAAASGLARAVGGSLLVATGPRTPPAAADALAAALAAPHHLHRWRPGADNPYPAFLALADGFLVTGDSASMLAEACGTGRPVQIFDLPERPDFRLRLARALRRLAGGTGPLRAAYDGLVDLGLLTSTRDMRAFHQALYARGLAAPFGAPAPERAAPPANSPGDELAATVARVRRVLDSAGKVPS
jgi:mitochondrial fission protein ELM1